MKETRVFVADLSSWYNSSTEEENIMDCAESQGTSYTLTGFVKAWNNGEIDSTGDQTVICMADVEDGSVTNIY